MHNFTKSDVSINDAYARAKYKLHYPRRNFLDNLEEEIKELYQQYDEKAENNQLETLESLWAEGDTITIEKESGEQEQFNRNKLAYDLYSSNKVLINEHWGNIQRLNNRYVCDTELLCPICGVRYCSEMDHYAPRGEGKFPEYSIHLTNLIPLCHECNSDKHEHWTITVGGVKKRIWFNAYFDHIDVDNIFISNIRIINNLPKITVEINPVLTTANPIHDVMIRTINKLNLCSLYAKEIRRKFTSKKAELKKELVRRGHIVDASTFWNEKKELFRDCNSDRTSFEFIDLLFYSAMLENEELDQWMIRELAN